MQQEQRQREQRQPAAAEHTPGQQIGREAGNQEEDVRRQVSDNVEFALSLRKEDAFDQPQRRLEDRPVHSVARRPKQIETALAGQMPQRCLANGALLIGVSPDAVVVDHGDAKQQRQHANAQRPQVLGACLLSDSGLRRQKACQGHPPSMSTRQRLSPAPAYWPVAMLAIG